MGYFSKIFCLILIHCGFIFITNAQSSSTKDSLKLYRKIETFSKKSKASKFFYSLFFRSLPFNTPATPASPVKTRIIAKQNYARFQGKPIRNIQISTYDPFGYDHRDTTRKPASIFEKAGNAVHVKTVHRTIRKLLIIKRNDRFDSLRVRESERLVRSQRFIHEVVFTPVMAGSHADSVDILIRAYDVWGIIVNTEISNSKYKLDVKDKSFLGLGHEFQNKYSRKHETGDEFYQAYYRIANIQNTHISSTLFFDLDELNNYNRSISFDRPFYSVFSKWAGGLYYLQHFNKATLYNSDSTAFSQNYRFNMHDHWAGKAWLIQKGQSEKARTTNFLLAGRIMDIHYVENPPPSFDTLHIYANERFYLLSTSLSRRRYDPDRYIFRYGTTEDVPVGRVYSLLKGYQVRNNTGRCYLGAQGYWSQYHPWGYLSTLIGYGTFFRNSRREEGVATINMTYFTNPLHLGKWKIRQFIKTLGTIGFNRPPTDNLTINEDLGLQGFNSTGLNGYSRKIVLTLQTQSYAPWDLIGFRFGPYLVSAFGLLGNETQGLNHSPVYSEFGIGVLLKNEYLIYQSLQISFAYYPVIPGAGNNVIKVNPIKTTDFGLKDFEAGKPSTIAYQ